MVRSTCDQSNETRLQLKGDLAWQQSFFVVASDLTEIRKQTLQNIDFNQVNSVYKV